MCANNHYIFQLHSHIGRRAPAPICASYLKNDTKWRYGTAVGLVWCWDCLSRPHTAQHCIAVTAIYLSCRQFCADNFLLDQQQRPWVMRWLSMAQCPEHDTFVLAHTAIISHPFSTPNLESVSVVHCFQLCAFMDVCCCQFCCWSVYITIRHDNDDAHMIKQVSQCWLAMVSIRAVQVERSKVSHGGSGPTVAHKRVCAAPCIEQMLSWFKWCTSRTHAACQVSCSAWCGVGLLRVLLLVSVALPMFFSMKPELNAVREMFSVCGTGALGRQSSSWRQRPMGPTLHGHCTSGSLLHCRMQVT